MDWYDVLFGAVGFSAQEAECARGLFEQHQVDFRDWDLLTYDHLKEMGIEKVSHRIRIMRHIRALCPATQKRPAADQGSRGVKRSMRSRHAEARTTGSSQKRKRRTKERPLSASGLVAFHQEEQEEEEEEEVEVEQKSKSQLSGVQQESTTLEQNMEECMEVEADQKKEPESSAAVEPDAMPLPQQQMTTAVQTNLKDLSQVGREERKNVHAMESIDLNLLSFESAAPEMSSTPRYHVVADRGLYTCGVSDCDDGTVLVVRESKPNPLPAEQQNQQERMASEEPGAMPLQQMTTAAQTDMTDLSQVGREGRKKVRAMESVDFELSLCGSALKGEEVSKASGEKEREPTSTSKQEGAQEHQQEASQERDIWSAAIRDLRGSTIGIHYYGDYVGACPYHFRTAGLLAYAVCDGSIAVLLTAVPW